MKVAVVDLGTNTCRLLLAEVADGRIVSVETRETRIVRLGQGVDGRGRLAPAAVDRTLACLAGHAASAAAYRPERSLLFATSALRDAADGEDFLRRAQDEHGWPWRIIDGEREGRLAFRGAVAGLERSEPGLLLVVDIGGGSTELIVGDGAGVEPRAVRSLDVGAVRLTERFFADDPPTDAQWEQAQTLVRETFAGARDAMQGGSPTRGIGLAGTFTTLVAYTLGLREYRRELVHGYSLTLAEVDAAIERFRELTSEQRAGLPGIQRGREDVILAGTLLAAEACQAFGLGGLRVSESDILEGAALWLADGLET